MNEYDRLIAGKVHRIKPSGFDVAESDLNPALFPWQRAILVWALRRGRCALFENCGLGKTFQQLEWAAQVVKHTGGKVLIICPLAVAHQTIREGQRFGYVVKQVRHDADVTESISIINYERLHHLDISAFDGVVLDESSILKSFNGKTRNMLTERFAGTRYKLCCTATPSPNDFTELGQHAAFLNVCTPAQMLATYFINDTFDTGTWRLKKHAELEFWKWVGSWAACVSMPSDIGFDDAGYDLPPIEYHEHVVSVDYVDGRGDNLFRVADTSATAIRGEMKRSAKDRSAVVARLVASDDEPWLVWCNTNQEADELSQAIPEAVEVRGSDSDEKKESAVDDFLSGKRRVLISKASMFGHGLNFQHCRNVAFVGLSYSFEEFYQAVRRSYRFGQSRIVRCHIVMSETEGAVVETVKRKMAQHAEMNEGMKMAAKAIGDEMQSTTMNTTIKTESGDGWTMYNGDCVRVMSEKIKNDSVHFSIFSPPFADLFTYSNDIQDMGNCRDMDSFMEQFSFCIQEIHRTLMPGRLCAVHCGDLLSTKWKDGAIELKDFSGAIAMAFKAAGFLYVSRITIWKSPVTEMQRTKAHGLLYKTLRGDSTKSRMGLPDYLLVFKKDGENVEPVIHSESDFPLDLWQEVASPVWMTVDQGRVLNGEEGRDAKDERHICPLQLDVIDRALMLYTNRGDTVLSPFAGIGSEGYASLRMGRKFIGAELKPSYFRLACLNMTNATAQLELAI